MSRRVAILFFAVVAAQVIGLLAFAGAREAALRGTEVILQTAPVDPRSLLQGDYAILDYEIASLPPRLADLPPGASVYVIIEDGGDVWRAVDYTRQRPAGDGDDSVTYIRGRVSPGRRLDFGIGAYFVPEGTGHIIEQAGDVKVVIALDEGGNAVIKRVLVDGAPFRPDSRQSDG